MLPIQIILGLINVLFGLFVIVFRKNISKSKYLVVFRLGRNFEDAFGRHGPKMVFILGLVPLIMGIILIILGILNINIYSL